MVESADSDAAGSCPGEQPPLSDCGALHALIWSGVRIYREGLLAALEADCRISSVAAVAEAADCCRAVAALMPTVVVVDALGEDAVAVAASVRASGTGVVAIAVEEDESEVLEFAEAGVSAYVTREQPLEALVEAIVAVARGETACTPQITGMLLRRVASVAAARRRGDVRSVRLTRREAEILSLVTDGLSNKQIAYELSIELTTVKNHVHSILEKLGVGSRTKAVAVTSGADPPVAITLS